MRFFLSLFALNMSTMLWGDATIRVTVQKTGKAKEEFLYRVKGNLLRIDEASKPDTWILQKLNEEPLHIDRTKQESIFVRSFKTFPAKAKLDEQPLVRKEDKLELTGRRCGLKSAFETKDANQGELLIWRLAVPDAKRNIALAEFSKFQRLLASDFKLGINCVESWSDLVAIEWKKEPQTTVGRIESVSSEPLNDDLFVVSPEIKHLGRSKLGPLRIGGSLMQKRLVHQSPISYPEEAKMNNIKGTVTAIVIVSENGSIESCEITQGPAELRAGVCDSILKWRYQPTLLNGEPVRVATAISVTFKR
jgi:TonB family protein